MIWRPCPDHEPVSAQLRIPRKKEGPLPLTAPLPHTLELLTQVLGQPVPWIAEQRIRELRRYVPRAYAPWTAVEELCLNNCVHLELDVRDISLLLLRQASAITVRLKQLGLPVNHHHSSLPLEEFIPTVLNGLFSTEPALPTTTGLAHWVLSQRPRAGRAWTPTEAHCLVSVMAQGLPVSEMTALFQRPWTEIIQQHHRLQARSNLLPGHSLFTDDLSHQFVKPG